VRSIKAVIFAIVLTALVKPLGNYMAKINISMP
jgi:hypothetical protein